MSLFSVKNGFLDGFFRNDLYECIFSLLLNKIKFKMKNNKEFLHNYCFDQIDRQKTSRTDKIKKKNFRNFSFGQNFCEGLLKEF